MDDDSFYRGETDTKQSVILRDERGRFTRGNKPVAGFDTHPENRSDGRWSKEESISYWYSRLLRMPLEDYKKFEPANYTQRMALRQINLALRSGSIGLRATIEITNRTEGRARYSGEPVFYERRPSPIIRHYVIPMPAMPDDFVTKGDKPKNKAI